MSYTGRYSVDSCSPNDLSSMMRPLESLFIERRAEICSKLDEAEGSCWLRDERDNCWIVFERDTCAIGSKTPVAYTTKSEATEAQKELLSCCESILVQPFK